MLNLTKKSIEYSMDFLVLAYKKSFDGNLIKLIFKQ